MEAVEEDELRLPYFVTWYNYEEQKVVELWADWTVI